MSIHLFIGSFGRLPWRIALKRLPHCKFGSHLQIQLLSFESTFDTMCRPRLQER